MKTKFDDNVAQNIPVTKDVPEPSLPWKISESELARIEAKDQNVKAAVKEPPLQVRAVFVVLLVVTIFVVIMNGMVNVAVDNNTMQMDVTSKEVQVARIKKALEKADREKADWNENAARLEKKISDLNAQKELYSAVIETLTKKTDDTLAN